MKKGLSAIYAAFDGKLVGSKRMQNYVCATVTLLPYKLIKYITGNCWFISSLDDAWAFTFTGNDLKNQHLIFLSDDLLHQNPEQIRHSIAHEIGHVMLGHRNSTLIRQTKREIRRQEKEADGFVKQFIPSTRVRLFKKIN